MEYNEKKKKKNHQWVQLDSVTKDVCENIFSIFSFNIYKDRNAFWKYFSCKKRFFFRRAVTFVEKIS